MVLELVGSRLLAPYFGNGIFVWTALIGIMLGFMSLGNYLGGRVADKHLSIATLYWILVTSAAGIALVAFIEPVVLPALQNLESLKMAAIIASVVLFAIPCIALGMITPFSARYAITSLDSSGQMVGSLFALGTLGSIAGTFIGGFYVIAWVGSHDLIAWLALIPLLLSLLFFKRPPKMWPVVGWVATAVLVLLAFVASASAFDGFDTNYDRYQIATRPDYEVTANPELQQGRMVTYLARDFKSMESAVYADTGEPFPFMYYDFYDMALDLYETKQGPLDKTLVVGGGTFSYPRYILQNRDTATVDVVEIDEALLQVARDHFFLVDDPRLDITIEDGRTFLNRKVRELPEGAANGPYDVIMLDTSKSAISIPYQMTTIETMQKCYTLLDDGGVLTMNMIASHRGAGARFVAAQYKTIAAVFPQVKLYAVFDETDAEYVQNMVIVATKADASRYDLSQTLREISPELTVREIPASELLDEKILTDDLAPADQLLSGIEAR